MVLIKWIYFPLVYSCSRITLSLFSINKELNAASNHTAEICQTTQNIMCTQAFDKSSFSFNNCVYLQFSVFADYMPINRWNHWTESHSFLSVFLSLSSIPKHSWKTWYAVPRRGQWVKSHPANFRHFHVLFNALKRSFCLLQSLNTGNGFKMISFKSVQGIVSVCAFLFPPLLCLTAHWTHWGSKPLLIYDFVLLTE